MNNLKLEIKRDWADSHYYDMVEKEEFINVFWSTNFSFKRLFDLLDTNTLVELACGHGRHSAHAMRLDYPISSLVLIDVNEVNIDHCRTRFSDRENVEFYVTSGNDMACCQDASVTAVFSYDAMVHFEYDDVAAYLFEIRRILKPGGRALLHHSNNSREPGKVYSDCVHWRNFMSTELFTHMSGRAGLTVLEQATIDWAGVEHIDAVTLLQREGESEKPHALSDGFLEGFVAAREQVANLMAHFIISEGGSKELSEACFRKIQLVQPTPEPILGELRGP